MANGNSVSGCSIAPPSTATAATAIPVPARNRPWRLTQVHVDVVGQLLEVGRWLEREGDGELLTHSLDAVNEAACEIAGAEALPDGGRDLLPEDLPGSGVAPSRPLACLAVGLSGVVLKGRDAAGKAVEQLEAWINTNRNQLLALKQQTAPAGAADTETTPPTQKPVGASVRA